MKLQVLEDAKTQIKEVTGAIFTVAGKIRRAMDVNIVDENGLRQGEVGYTGPIVQATSSSKLISPPITVDTAAYTIGDCIGGKLTLTDAVRVSGGSGVLQTITIVDSSNIKPALEIIIFNSNPNAATLTDGSAIAFSTDVSKVIQRIPVYTSDYTTVGGVAIATITPGMIVQAVGSANLYAALNAVAAHDFVAATDLQVKFGLLQD